MHLEDKDPQTRAGWLAHEGNFWALLTAVVFTVAALKGLHWPGTWALTQSLVDYSHGFLKRGLLGAVYTALGVTQQESLRVIYFVELAGLLALLAVFTRRTGLVRPGSRAVAALLAGSYATTFLFHIVGYTDIPNAAIMVGLLLVRESRWRFPLAVPLVIAGLLIHENFLFLCMPLLLLSFYLEGLARPQHRRRIWSLGGALGLIAAGMTLFLTLHAPMSKQQVAQLIDYVSTRSTLDVRIDYFQVFTKSFAATMDVMSKAGWHQYLWWTYQAVSVCVLGPVLALLLRFCWRSLKGYDLHVKLVVFVAMLVPLCLHLLGLDQVRWNVWVVVNAYLALGLLAWYLPDEPLRISVAERSAIVLVIALGMASGYGLFDGARINPYPFFPKPLGGLIEQHDTPLPGFSIDPD